MPRRSILGELQLAIMHVLWEQGEAAVSDVHEALLAERGLAPTTVATMLVKMERKGIVAHRSAGRKFLYRTTVSEREVRRSMVSDLTDRLFAGDVTALVSHLVSEHGIETAEVEELKERIAEREQEGE